MPESPSSWREVFASLQHRDLRLPLLLALAMSAAGYMICFAVAFASATLVYKLGAMPALTAIAGFGHGHVSTTAQVLAGLAAGEVVGVPLLVVCVKVMYWLAGCGPGRDVAVRNAEVLVNGRTEERA